jgi:hypothetical protein
MALPAHVTTISNQHGNYTTLARAQGSQAHLYLVYPAVDSIVCKSFALPYMPAAPRVLDRSALEAAGFKLKGLQPLRDAVAMQASGALKNKT